MNSFAKHLSAEHSRAVREQFAARSPTYDSYNAWASDQRIVTEIARPLEHLQDDALCLEVGAGTGILANHLAQRSGKWISIDLSESMLRKGGRRPSVVGDARFLPLKGKSISAVVARSMVSYVDPLRLIQESRRVLIDDGTLVVAEKVLGDYEGNAEEWYAELQALRNPLKGPPLRTHDLAATIRASRLKLASVIEFRRTYSYPLNDWLSRMGTIDLSTQERTLFLLQNSPAISGEKLAEIKSGELRVALSWGVLCARREDGENQPAKLIATVIPVRVRSEVLETYMQYRLEPVYREPEFIGNLEFPQGHVEASESIRDAASRELREEAGMEISRILWDSTSPTSGLDRAVTWEGFDRVGLIRARGRLDYVAACIVAEVRESSAAASLNNCGRWLPVNEAVTAMEAGQVYPLNVPMVRMLETSQSGIRSLLA